MNKFEYENNFCEVIGKIVSEPILSHEIYDEKFYGSFKKESWSNIK